MKDKGHHDNAKNVFAEYLATLPRQIDAQLDDAEQRGLISGEDSTYLKKAALQHEDEYRLRVSKWVR